MHPIIAIGIAGLSFSFFPLMNTIGMLNSGPVLFSFFNHIATMMVSLCIFFILFKNPKRAIAALKQIIHLPKNVLLIGLLSGIAIYLGCVFFLFALQLMSRAGATMIAEMWPAMAIFIAPLLIRKHWERVSIFDILMLGVCVIGVIFISASESGQSFSEFLQKPFFMSGDTKFEEYIGIMLAVLAAYCWSFSNVSRAHFANSLPQDFRDEYLDGGVTIREAIFTYIVTYIAVMPLVFMLLFVMESSFVLNIKAVIPALLNGLFLTLTSTLYSYALLKSTNSNINVLWYFAPLLASVWLVMFGFSVATDMIVIGGGLILFANIALVLVADSQKRGEAAFESDLEEMPKHKDDELSQG